MAQISLSSILSAPPAPVVAPPPQTLHTLLTHFGEIVSDPQQVNSQRCFDVVIRHCDSDEGLKKIQQVANEILELQSIDHTILVDLIHQGNEEAVRRVFQRNVQALLFKNKDIHSSNLLHEAAANGNVVIFQIILEHAGIPINQRIDGLTPLHVAIKNGKEMIVRLLSERGAKSIRVTHQGNELMPEAWAIVHGQLDCFEVLVNLPSFDSWTQTTSDMGNLLHIAIEYKQLNLLKLLLSKYIDQTQVLLKKTNSKGETPFLFAARVGFIEAVKLLYTKEVNIQGRNDLHRTALHLAALSGHQDVARFLVEYGVDYQAQDIHRKTAVDYAQPPLKGILENKIEEIEIGNKNPPDFRKYPPENWVLCGGGVKGLAFGGVILAAEKIDGCLSRMKRVIGTSAGAICASLWAVGYTGTELVDILARTNLMDFLDHPFTTEALQKDTITKMLRAIKMIRDPIKILKALRKFEGICEGEKLRIWIEDMIYKKTGIHHCTFGELHNLILKGNGNYKHLHVYGIKLGLKDDEPQIMHFSSENPEWEHLIISDADRISLSVPGAFKPHFLWFKDKNGLRYKREDMGRYIDGGLVYNLPLESCDEMGYQFFNLPAREALKPIFNRGTLGFKLFTPNEKPPQPRELNLKSLISEVVGIYFHAESLIRNLVPANKDRIARVSNEGIKTMQFNLTADEQKKLINSGINSLCRFLKVDVPPGLITHQGQDIPNNPVKKPTNVWEAVEAGDLDYLKTELEGGFFNRFRSDESLRQNFNQVNHKGRTLLHMAAQQGNAAVFQYLLDKGADPTTPVNQSDSFNAGCQAIHFACYYKNHHLIRPLIDKKVDINALGRLNQTPIQIATAVGDLESIKVLVELGANVNHVDKEGRTSLHFAAQQDNLEIFQFLLDSHADPKCAITIADRYNKDYQPIHIACYFGRSEFIHPLIEKGVDINALGYLNQTPIQIATSLGNIELMDLILDFKADIMHINSEGKSCLHIAAEQGQLEALKWLLDKGFNVNTPITAAGKWNKGYQPLHLACQKGHYYLIEELLDRGAQLEGKGYLGRTALHMATHNGHVKATDVLLKRGANINAVADLDDSCTTPLLEAIGKHKLPVVALLLDGNNSQLDINKCNRDGNSPLFIAVVQGLDTIIPMIVNYPNYQIPQDPNDVNHPLNLLNVIPPNLAESKKQRIKTLLQGLVNK